LTNAFFRASKSFSLQRSLKKPLGYVKKMKNPPVIEKGSSLLLTVNPLFNRKAKLDDRLGPDQAGRYKFNRLTHKSGCF